MAKAMELRISAAAVIVKDKKILLCKRSKNERLFPEYWTCPGGKLDNPEELLSEVVKREVKEEIGLDFQPTKMWGFYEMIQDDFHNISHVFLGEISGKIKIDKEEVKECKWFIHQETKDLPIAFSYREAIEDLHKKGIL